MRTDVLFVTTGEKKEVFKSTYILKRTGVTDDVMVSVLTEENCFDFFSTIESDSIKIYPITMENIFILLAKHFESIISRANTELGQAFIQNYEKWHSYPYAFPPPTIIPPPFGEFYYFKKSAHPIDIIHSRIKKGPNPLFGICIGEGPNPYVKPPFSFLKDLIKAIYTSFPNAKIALFGSNSNDVRVLMLKRTFGNQMVLFTDIEDSVLLAQALEFCDVFVSFDGFLLNLSVAVGTKTIGLFANTDPIEMGSFNHLIKLTAQRSPQLRSACTYPKCPIKTHEVCEPFENIDDNCFGMFEVKKVMERIKLFMEM
jgi:ADP-heptose:LPS heptosyltransferase